MKKLILGFTLGISLGLVINVWTSWDYPFIDKNDIKIKYPQYMLVIRYLGYGRIQQGDSAYSLRDWIYLYEPYDSLKEVVDRLNTYSGNGMSKESKENDLVGLWELGEKKNIINTLKFEEIKHKKEIKIDHQEWIENKWSIE